MTRSILIYGPLTIESARTNLPYVRVYKGRGPIPTQQQIPINWSNEANFQNVVFFSPCRVAVSITSRDLQQQRSLLGKSVYHHDVLLVLYRQLSHCQYIEILVYYLSSEKHDLSTRYVCCGVILFFLNGGGNLYV